MKEWKIALAIGLIVALTVLITGIAYASYFNATTRPPTYSSYSSGAYGSYPYTGYPQYPTYPNTPAYPTQPNAPVYPQQPAYPPGYGYPYGSYGEHGISPWGGMG